MASEKSSDSDPSEKFIDDLRLSQFRAKSSPQLRARGLTDLQCWHFIDARRSQGLEDAVAMAEAWLQWRQQPLAPGGRICPDNVLQMTHTEFIDGLPHKELFPIALHGEDLEGRPVYWEGNGRITANFPRIKQLFTLADLLVMHVRTQELTALRMEKLTARHGRLIDKVLVVFDVDGLPLVPDFGAIEYAQHMLSMDQRFYPETLFKLIIINAPWYFTALFTVIRPFLDARTVERVVILGHDYLDTLREFVDDSQIPPELGGSSDPVPWGGPWADSSGCSRADVEARLAQLQTE